MGIRVDLWNASHFGIALGAACVLACNKPSAPSDANSVVVSTTGAPAIAEARKLDVSGAHTPKVSPTPPAPTEPDRPTEPVPPPPPLSYSGLARGEAEPAPTTQVPIAFASVDQPLATSAKLVRSIRPTFDGLEKMYALATQAVGVPVWGSLTTGDPAAARDDDLYTSWSCAIAEGSRCAWMARFSEPVDVRAVRFFAGGTNSRAISVLRVHTDTGYVDIKRPSSGKHRHIVFATTVKTRHLALEVIKASKRPADVPVRLSEVEIYGESGPARAPLDLDPALAHVRFSGSPWVAQVPVATDSAASDGQESADTQNADGPGTFTLDPQVCLHTVGRDGKARCLLRGTALFGRRGDRVLLAEFVTKTNCETTLGSYILIDQKTRRLIDLGAMAGIVTPIYRRLDGTGFAGLRRDEQRDPDLQGYFGYEIKPDGTLAKRRESDRYALVGNGYEALSLARGGGAVHAPDPACHLPSLAEVTKIVEGLTGAHAEDVRGDVLVDYDGEEFPDETIVDSRMVCPLPDGSTWMLDRDNQVLWVAEGRSALWVPPEHDLMMELVIRMARQDQTWWIEQFEAGTGRPLLAQPTGGGAYTTVVPQASFAVRAPAACEEPFFERGPADIQHAIDLDNETREALATLATLRPAARDVLEEWASVEEIGAVELGDLNRDGSKDALVRVDPIGDIPASMEGLVEYILVLSQPGGAYITEEIQSIYGLAHEVSFDVLRSGKRVVLVHDTENCCHEGMTILQIEDGALEERERHEAGEEQDIEIQRDDQGRIKRIKVIGE